MRASRQKSSVAQRIIKGLEEFIDALESGEDLAQRFNCWQVTLDFQTPVYDAKRVKEVRRALGTSQAILALLLGVATKTVSAWEQGANTPCGMACRFLEEIRRNPAYWRSRIREATVSKKIETDKELKKKPREKG
jgi:DNA-binding transcriptional regulator YiaG